ncbi:MAG: RNA polymerase factor sigma-54 [Tannerella sp.]|jgi:RNA polymerase sigma-54 factor|nr:RNA polymerase factor sigma-54 [Tannerella sp.]
MAIKQQQRVRQGLEQRQWLSPQQIQTIKMLELPTLELEEYIKNELEENPALEEGKEIKAEENDFGGENEDDDYDSQDANEDLSLGDYMYEDDIPDYKLAEISSREEHRESVSYNSDLSLSDYLLQQLQLQDLPETDRKIGEYIIGNIDDYGYLSCDLKTISDQIAFQSGEEYGEEELSDVLSIIRDFDPPGVGAMNLQECLLLQLKKRKDIKERLLAIKILSHYFDDFSGKHFEKIRKSLNISEEQMKSAIEGIKSLNPKPGSNWDNSMTTIMNHVTPDFIVETAGDGITMSLNNGGIPNLRINREYADMLKDYSGNKANRTADMKSAVMFVKQKIDAAQGFIDAVRQRQETLERTMDAIIRLQSDFFLYGDESKLHPMILKDVAQKTGYDISTISRVSNSKYVQTNFGVYPLKFFFSESAQTESGETVSTRKIKQIIKDEVDAEDKKKKPLTDEELTAKLKSRGFATARRTVAKYREQLGIPIARMRKEI